MTISKTDLDWAAGLVYKCGDKLELISAAKKNNIKQFLHYLAPMVAGSEVRSPVRKACLVLWPNMEGNVCEPTFDRYFQELFNDGWSGNEVNQALKARGVKFPDPSPQFEEVEEFINRSIATPSKEEIMKAFETISYVYGNNITTMTQEQLLSAIKKAEGEKEA